MTSDLEIPAKYRRQNPEVLYSEAEITLTDRSEIDLFKQLSTRNPRKRIRLCSHGNAADRLHEMIIVHEKGAFVPPHKHPGKSESTHIIEGLVDVIVFDDSGNIDRVIRMGDYLSGRTFFYRMSIPLFHTLRIRSDILVFHETTNGPFDRKDTVFAPWAPEENDIDAVNTFLSCLDNKINKNE